MSSNGGPGSVPPFPPEYRASGLLMHVTSLPSPYGIGDLGSSAFSWVDRLHDAGQSMVAVAAARSDRLWEFSVPVDVVICRERAC